MDYFKKYTSNTLAGSGNQIFFCPEDENKIQKCRIFYKIFCGGRYNYSFLMSNIIDGTFADGSISHKNIVVDEWRICEAKIGISDACNEQGFDEPRELYPVLFGESREKTVAPGEFFCSAPSELDVKKDQYICIELSFKGGMIPYHEESIIPSFVFDNGAWIPSKKHPFLSMLGVDRAVKKRIAFLGDSITQGIGVDVNSYKHWNVVVAQKLGCEFSYWNLGLGYGRADDAASDGAWLYKAKQNDLVVVCFGVNDINRDYDAKTIKKNLQTIVDKLYERNIEVIIQTVPPFDYSPERAEVWREVNDFILYECKNVKMRFDCVALLAKSDDEPHKAKYGGHPNEEGCRIWGESLAEAMLNSKLLNFDTEK